MSFQSLEFARRENVLILQKQRREMSLDDWLKRMDATDEEATELRWYLAFLRWKRSVQSLLQ
jgi:hypothetical protein